MAVKIRLKRLGKIRAPHYRIVIADARSKRDGRVIEEIGKYHPTEHPSFIEVNSERARYWLSVGAQPTEAVLAILKLTGDWDAHTGSGTGENRVLAPETKAPFVAETGKKPVLKPKSEPAEKPAAETAPDAAADEEPAADAPADEAAEAGEPGSAE